MVDPKANCSVAVSVSSTHTALDSAENLER